MTPQEIQAAAEAQFAEQTRLAQERAQVAADAADDAKFERDCITTASG